MARGDLTPQEIELRKIISNNINSLLDIKNKKQIDDCIGVLDSRLVYRNIPHVLLALKMM